MIIKIENGKLADVTELKEAVKNMPNGEHKIEFVKAKKEKSTIDYEAAKESGELLLDK